MVWLNRKVLKLPSLNRNRKTTKMELNKAIRERHSVRRYSSKKPDWRKIIEIIDAANLAPLAGNIFALRYILVDDKEKIKQLAEASQQDFIATAHYVVVICSYKAEIVRSFDERAHVYTRQQAGAAIENFLLKITDLGMATCWVGAFADDIVKRILRIPDDVDVEAILPVGYEMIPKSKQRPKGNLDSFMFFNEWKQRFQVPKRRPEA